MYLVPSSTQCAHQRQRCALLPIRHENDMRLHLRHDNDRQHDDIQLHHLQLDNDVQLHLQDNNLQLHLRHADHRPPHRQSRPAVRRMNPSSDNPAGTLRRGSTKGSSASFRIHPPPTRSALV